MAMNRPIEPDCRPLRTDEFDGLGTPRDAIVIECIDYKDLGGQVYRFWVARCPTLPGYDGEGVTPTDAIAALMTEFKASPIFRVKPPKDERAAISRWRNQGRRAREAVAFLGGKTRSSEGVESAARQFGVGKPAVASLNRKIFETTANRVGRPFTVEDEKKMRAWLAEAINSPGNAAMAEAIHNNEPHHRLLKRWAREKFPSD